MTKPPMDHRVKRPYEYVSAARSREIVRKAAADNARLADAYPKLLAALRRLIDDVPNERASSRALLRELGEL